MRFQPRNSLSDFQDMFNVPKDSIKPAPGKPHESLVSHLDAITKAARECLDLPAFHAYKAIYEKSEKRLLTEMLRYTEAALLQEDFNPSVYGARMLVYVQKIATLRSLLKAVEADASRRTGDEDEKQTR